MESFKAAAVLAQDCDRHFIIINMTMKIDALPFSHKKIIFFGKKGQGATPCKKHHRQNTDAVALSRGVPSCYIHAVALSRGVPSCYIHAVALSRGVPSCYIHAVAPS